MSVTSMIAVPGGGSSCPVAGPFWSTVSALIAYPMRILWLAVLALAVVVAIVLAVKLALGGFALARGELGLHVPFLPQAELSLEIAPALLGVGYILGYRQSAIMVAGSSSPRARAPSVR